MKLLCLHQKKFWTHLAIREASICCYIRGEREGCCQTCVHTQTPRVLHGRTARAWSRPQPAALPGLSLLNAKSIPLFPGQRFQHSHGMAAWFESQVQMFIAKESKPTKEVCLSHKHVGTACGSKLADGYRFVRLTIHCTSVSANMEFTQNCLSRHFFT